MKSPFKTTYLLLGIFAVLLVIVLFFENSSVDQEKIEAETTMPIFTESQVKGINKIEFISPTIEGKDPVTLTISRDLEGKWTVNGHLIDTAEELKLYEYIRGAGLGKVVSKNEENWDKYELTDEKAKKAVIYINENPISTLYFGSMGTNYQTVYSRRNADKQVYLVDSDFSDLFNYDVNRWRSKELFRMNKDDVTAMKVRIGQETWIFAKENDVWTQVNEQGSVTIEDQEKFKEYLEKVYSQKGSAIESDQTKFESADNAVALTLKNSEEYVVAIDVKEDPPENFARVSAQSDLIRLDSDMNAILRPDLTGKEDESTEKSDVTDGTESDVDEMPEPVFEYTGD